jgi:hypothetical protein
MITHTPIPDFLNMSLHRFHTMWGAMLNVLEKRQKK